MNENPKLHQYIDLWKSENSIKTEKLMAYFAIQTLIAIGATATTSHSHAFYFFGSLGIATSLWWICCIARTIGFQRLWKMKITDLDQSFFPTKSENKSLLNWYEKVPSKIILLAPPTAGAVVWTILLWTHNNIPAEISTPTPVLI